MFDSFIPGSSTIHSDLVQHRLDPFLLADVRPGLMMMESIHCSKILFFLGFGVGTILSMGTNFVVHLGKDCKDLFFC